MKTQFLPILLASAIVAAGCASAPDRAARCESYAAIYSAYSAASAAREISSEEIAAAAAAAAFLSLYCGWLSPKPAPGSRGPAPVDQNGVPIVFPP